MFGVLGWILFGLVVGIIAKLLMPVSERSFSASGPDMKKLTMWCDWSNRTAVSRQDFCSRRQLVNSAGTTG